MVTARQVKPNLAIVFEGTPADEGYLDDTLAQGVLNKGPQINSCQILNRYTFYHYYDKIKT